MLHNTTSAKQVKLKHVPIHQNKLKRLQIPQQTTPPLITLTPHTPLTI